MERAFITGRGLITPLGNSLPVNEAALRAGKSGIVTIDSYVEHQLPSTVGGMPDMYPQTELIDRKSLRFCPPVGVMSVVAAQEVFAEAGLSLDEVRNKRIALIGGVASSNAVEIYDDTKKYCEAMKLRTVTPFAVPRIMPSSAISVLSLIFGITGESYDISAACASSALAIIVGTRLIRSGQYDMVLAGGAEQIDWVSALGFCACRALSHSYNDTPAIASRPFDEGRDGFVLAGGAAYVLLESERSVKARGVRPICEVSGIAANSNAHDMVVPEAKASAAMMREALLDARITPAELDYINTHGTATLVGDQVEMEAIHELVGRYRPAINSTKSQTGHMVGATGAAEVIFSSMMLEKGFISPSINLDKPSPEFGWADLVRECREGVRLRHALSNSFAFGGSNAAILLSKCD